MGVGGGRRGDGGGGGMHTAVVKVTGTDKKLEVLLSY